VGVDLQTGSGLDGVLDAVEVAVDATNGDRTGRGPATAFFTTVANRLVTAAKAHGLRRLVLVSIVGIDRVPGFPYYQAKLAQEAAYRAAGVPLTIARVTQFHEFGAQVLARTRKGPLAVVPRMRIQPVAARTAGHEVAGLAIDPDPPSTIEIGGPGTTGLVELARATAIRRGRRVAIIPVRVPGRTGAALRGGALLPGPDARIAGPPLDEWLQGDDLLAVPW
jgi:uncharacterized protein YbjT (DUF2867 family)